MKCFIAVWIIIGLVSSMLVIPQRGYAQESLNLPVPGTMVNLSRTYEPVLIKGLKVHPENPLLFDFILDTGRSGLKVNSPEFESESKKLIKYFLASLTIKEDNLWVNLSPYEKNRMIPDELGKTELGRDMLMQDYVLKQLTASLIYPEKRLGKEFWNRVYMRSQEMFGAVDVPINTFNKVWIVADKAKVLERNNVAYVISSHLKVMLEEDYMALGKHSGVNQVGRVENKSHAIASQIVREIIIPELEKEVNEGQNFAPLRQMFYSMIIASWYKLALKDALLNQVYSNRGKTAGVQLDDPTVKEKIYERYLSAYKKGVFNYIKEDINMINKQPILRKYFSGGERIFEIPPEKLIQRVHKLGAGENLPVDGDLAMAAVDMIKESKNPAMNGVVGQDDQALRLAVAIRSIGHGSKYFFNINPWNYAYGSISYVEGVFHSKGISLSGNYSAMVLPSFNALNALYTQVSLNPSLLYDHATQHELIQKMRAVVAVCSSFLGEIESQNNWSDAERGEINKRVFLLESYVQVLNSRLNIYQGIRSQEVFEVDSLEKKIKEIFKANARVRIVFYDHVRKRRIQGDQISILSALYNLINNGLEAGSDVSVGLFADLQEESIVMRVVDNGPGFTSEQLAFNERGQRNLFSINNTTKVRGSGLGTTEAKLAIEDNGGVVDVQNQKAGGAEYIIKFSLLSEASSAMLALHSVYKMPVSNVLPPGGIDLNVKHMNLDVLKGDQGVKMKFDPAMIAEFHRLDFSGISPFIIRITPIQSLFSFLAF